MRTLTGDALAHASAKMGEDPILVLRVDWRNAGSRWYADRDLPSAEGRMLHVAAITAQRKQDSVGMISAFAIELEDGDGALKTLLDTNALERTPASLFQQFQGGLDKTLLFQGEIVGPIEWSESSRTLKFELETKVVDLPVGFAIDQDTFLNSRAQYPLLNPDVIGQAWPLAFGSVVHLPALKVLTPARTVLNQTYKKPTAPQQVNFLVDDSTFFPAGEIDVIIDGMVFRGSFVGNTFYVGDPNVPKYEGIPFDARDSSDKDVNNPFVAWISKPISIVNNFIYINDEFRTAVYYRVVRQEGKKIWLDRKVGHFRASSETPTFLQSPTVIAEVAKLGRKGWDIKMSAQSANAYGYEVSTPSYVVQTIVDVNWHFDAGSEVQLWASPAGTGNHATKWIANLLPSSVVKAVYAFRTNPRNGIRQLWSVPQQYYTVNLSDTVLGKTCTTVTVANPLAELSGQGFEEQIHVSLKSTVGPNISDVVKYLFQTYSNLVPDDASFTAVKGLTVKHPVGFALFDLQNVLSVCEEIFWQGRCGLIYEGGIVFAKYLSAQPTVDYTIDESKVEHRTIILGFTSTEEIVTQLWAQWKRDYSGIKYRNKVFLYSENQALYGLKKRYQDFYVYNVDSLAIKSAKFWGHRLANSWRLLKLNTLERVALALEMFDCVNAAFNDGTLLGQTFKTVVDAHSYNTEDDDSSFSLSLWLPSIAGTLTQDPNAWMDDSGDPTPIDPVDALTETPLVVEYPDDLSNHVTFRPPQTHPAIIVRAALEDQITPGGYFVNVYDNGYPKSWPPTELDPPSTLLNADGTPQNIEAWPVEQDILRVLDIDGNPANIILVPGTKVAIFTVTGNEWLFHVPADAANNEFVVTTNVTGGEFRVNVYGNGRVSPDGTPQAPTSTNVPVKLPDITTPAPAIGDTGVSHWKGQTQVWQPTGGTADIFARISGGSGPYTFIELKPDGTDKPSGITGTANEVTGSTVVPPEPVFIKRLSDGNYYFWYPIQDCS